MSFFAELRRRNVIRVALAYTISAWVLIQVMEIASDAFEAPAWVLKIVITLLVIGAVPTLIFSWVFEMTPKGLRKESDLDPGADRQTTGKLNIAVIVLLVIAIGLFAGQRFLPGSGDPGPPAPDSGQAEPAAAAPLGPKSVAVLPFENFSASQDDAHFSDGLADTVLHRLAQVDDLTVIARNSSFVYKGGNVDIRQVGEDLGVANVLEGSVQRQGDRLRVIAQLIETRTGTHLWSETYDRSLSDIFSIQDEISLSVAEALQAELLGDEAARLTETGTDDSAAWALYLAGKEALWTTGLSRLDEAYELLTQAIARDPNFLEAYQTLANYYDIRAWTAPNPTVRSEALQNGFEAVNRAIALDPADALNLQVFGSLLRRNYQTLEAIALLEAYVRLNPNDAASYFTLGLAQHNAGLYKQAHESFSKARRLDPMEPFFYRPLGFTSVDLGRIDEGIQWYRRGIEETGWPVFTTDLAGRVLGLVLGQWYEALETLRRHPLDDRVGVEKLLDILLALGMYDETRRLIPATNALLDDPPFVARMRLVLANFDGPPADAETVALAVDGDLFSRTRDFQAWRCITANDHDCVVTTLKPLGESFFSSFTETPMVGDVGDYRAAAWLALAELRAGDPDRGQRLLTHLLERAEADLEVGEPGCYRAWCGGLGRAELRAALGDTDGALAALDATLPQGDDSFLRWGLIPNVPIEDSPFLDSLRDDPAFQAFMAELRDRQARMRERVRPLAEEVLGRIEAAEAR